MTRHRDQRGAFAIIMAISAVAIFGFAALAVDLAHARDVRRDSQNASDASALAAGEQLYLAGTTPDISGAVAKAKTYALANFGVALSAWDSCSDSQHLVVPSGSTQCVSFSPNLTRPVTVRVLVPLKRVDTPFGGVLGHNGLNIGSYAHAMLDPGGKSRCGLCVLGSGMTHDLQNGDATVHGADIHFNGNVNVGPNGLVATDGAITVEGSASGGYTNYVPDPSIGQPPISDPLAFLQLPPAAMAGLTVKTDPCGTGATHGPGIYGSVNLRNATCTLQPGLYVIAGSGAVWDLAGNSDTHLNGSGVTLYFTCGTTAAPRVCNPGESGGTMDASGNGTIGITAPTSGALQGLALLYDRGNAATLRLTGNGSDNMTGTIYLSGGTLQMNGNGCSQNYYALIVVKDLEMNGNPACLQSTYAQNQNVEIPPTQLHLTR